MNSYEFQGTYYYRYILDPCDREVLRILSKKVLHKGSQTYENGLLVANIKIKTICLETGIKYDRVKECINKLDRLGLVIKLPKKIRNRRYFLGFRTKNDERRYLYEHLVNRYEGFIKDHIEDRIKELECVSWQIPKIVDDSPYKIDSNYRCFITDFISDPKILLNRYIKDGKNLVTLLFGVDDVYRKPFDLSIPLELPR
jgi:hypothetical protein